MESDSDDEINNVTYFILLIMPGIFCFLLSLAQIKLEKYVSWVETEFLTSIIFFAIFMNIVCYESYHIIESEHKFKTFPRAFILTSQRLLFYLGLIICMFVEKLLIQFNFDALSEKTVMKPKTDESKTIVSMNDEDDDSSTNITDSNKNNVSHSIRSKSEDGYAELLEQHKDKTIQLNKESLKIVVSGNYDYENVVEGVSKLDSSKSYSRQNLELYCKRRYNHRIMICALTFLSMSLFLLTTNIDRKVLNNYYTFTRVCVFIFSKMFITFCTMHTMIDLKIHNYTYLFACFCFPVMISMNIYFRKKNNSPEVFYDVSFLQMFLSGIILYLAVCNYQYSKSLIKDKRNIVLALFTILFSFFMTVAL